MKILHTGDWHVTEGPRLLQTLACIDAMIAHAELERVDLVLVGGDMHGTTVPHVATVKERNAVALRLSRLARLGPVVLIYGNHDSPGDLDVYDFVGDGHLVSTFHEPARSIFETAAGPVEVNVLPYPSKRYYGASLGVDAPGILGQKQTVEGALRAILAGWREPLILPRCPRVGLMHLNIGGSHVGGGERILIGQEIELAPADLEELGLDYIGLSHIHQQQRMARGAYYAGTPAPQDFGHTAPCGYMIVRLNEPDGLAPLDVGFHLTPAPPMRTCVLAWETAAPGGDGWHLDESLAPQPGEFLPWQHVAGVELKLRLIVREEDTPDMVALAELERELLGAGALRVVRELETIPRTRTRAPEIATASTLPEKLGAYWRSIDERARPTDAQQAAALARLEEIDHAG